VIDVTNDGNQQPPDYLLSDSVDLESPYGKILSLEVASDKEANYNKFFKRIEEARERGIKRVMPLFSFEELGYVLPPGTSMVCNHFRYEVFGGSARNVLARQRRPDAVILPVVDETMTMLFPDIKTGDFAAWEEAAKQVSDRLLTSKDSHGNSMTVSSMMWHMQPSTHKRWASKYMEWLATAIVDRRTTDVYEELNRIITSSGVGFLFESIGHRKLLMNTADVLLKPLFASKPDEELHFETARFNLSVVRFKTIDEIGSLPDGTYGLPMTPKFPLIDAVIQPDTLIQFTVSPIKHKGSSQSLSGIRAQLHAPPDQHRLIFVIPRENIETFRFHTDLKEIRQFLCLAETSVVHKSSLLNANEKKAWKARNPSEEII